MKNRFFREHTQARAQIWARRKEYEIPIPEIEWVKRSLVTSNFEVPL